MTGELQDFLRSISLVVYKEIGEDTTHKPGSYIRWFRDLGAGVRVFDGESDHIPPYTADLKVLKQQARAICSSRIPKYAFNFTNKILTKVMKQQNRLQLDIFTDPRL